MRRGAGCSCVALLLAACSPFPVTQFPKSFKFLWWAAQHPITSPIINRRLWETSFALDSIRKTVLPKDFAATKTSSSTSTTHQSRQDPTTYKGTINIEHSKTQNMAAETNGPPSGAPPAQEPAKNTPAPANAPAAAAASTEKLTPAQLKAKAKAEKAARRAQVKEARAAAATAAPTQQPGGGPGADVKGGKGKGKQDGQPGQGKLLAHRPSVSGRRPSIMPAIEKDVRSGIPESFSHVPMAKRIPTSQAHKDVHPAVLAVGQQMATFALKDSISRLKATLLAFRKVRILLWQDYFLLGHRSLTRT